MSKQELIQRGAEAKIFLDKEKNLIIKERIKKGYRINEIDHKIRKQRTKAEKKILKKASEIINSPKPKEEDEDYKIIIPYIKGKKISESLEEFEIEKQKKIMREIGNKIAKLHNNNIIHGDLTTSNFIFNEEENKTYTIDFGLGFISQKIEDKAVDLHLLKQALETKHSSNYQVFFEEFLEGYKKESKDFDKILQRLKALEKRGRYKGG
ncbi:Kae1-associated serine/threonine protein kinase [Candidatus Woesearchaeota archaeon]|nr:Kae1-associated serine/threonine protein kinase [Candidatus Woesearchaeota archaeon]